MWGWKSAQLVFQNGVCYHINCIYSIQFYSGWLLLPCLCTASTIDYKLTRHSVNLQWNEILSNNYTQLSITLNTHIHNHVLPRSNLTGNLNPWFRSRCFSDCYFPSCQEALWTSDCFSFVLRSLTRPPPLSVQTTLKQSLQPNKNIACMQSPSVRSFPYSNLNWLSLRGCSASGRLNHRGKMSVWVKQLDHFDQLFVSVWKLDNSKWFEHVCISFFRLKKCVLVVISTQ